MLLQDLENEDLPRINAETNQSLHCMAAHLHRYGSKLRSLSEIINDFKVYNLTFNNKFVAHRFRSEDSLGLMRTLDQACSHISAISTFRDELEHKIDNVLALVCFISRSRDLAIKLTVAAC